MAVEVVRAEVGYQGHLGAAVDRPQVFELETRELQDDPIFAVDAFHFVEQGDAEVATHTGALRSLTSNLCREQSGGGFAVRSGDGADLSATELEEEVHFGLQRHTLTGAPAQDLGVSRHGRIGEDHVGVEKVTLSVLPEYPLYWQAVERRE